MKCKSCGYNLGLEDNWCPHCGTRNEQAEMHNRDMEKFNREFEETLDEVKSNARKFNALSVKITVAAVLVALIAISILMNLFSDDIAYSRRKKDIHKNMATYDKELKGYMEARDINGLVIYYESNKLNNGDSKDVGKYLTVYQVSRCYVKILENVTRLVDQSQLTNYYTKDQCIERIQNDIGYFKDFSSKTKHNEVDFQEGREEYIDYVAQLLQDALQVHFKLTDEEAAGIWDMSSGRICVMLEEGLER